MMLFKKFIIEFMSKVCLEHHLVRSLKLINGC